MEHVPSNISAYLSQLTKLPHRNIERTVALWLVDESNPIDALEKLFEHGCIGGAVPCMIHYEQTHQFFDTHYKHINQLYRESEVQIPRDGCLKNWLAWFAFETVAHSIYLVLEGLDEEE